MPHKRFFTKEIFFNQLQTSLGNKPQNPFQKLRSAVQKRLPKKNQIV